MPWSARDRGACLPVGPGADEEIAREQSHEAVISNGIVALSLWRSADSHSAGDKLGKPNFPPDYVPVDRSGCSETPSRVEGFSD